MFNPVSLKLSLAAKQKTQPGLSTNPISTKKLDAHIIQMKGKVN